MPPDVGRFPSTPNCLVVRGCVLQCPKAELIDYQCCFEPRTTTGGILHAKRAHQPVWAGLALLLSPLRTSWDETTSFARCTGVFHPCPSLAAQNKQWMARGTSIVISTDIEEEMIAVQEQAGAAEHGPWLGGSLKVVLLRCRLWSRFTKHPAQRCASHAPHTPQHLQASRSPGSYTTTTTTTTTTPTPYLL